MRTAASHGTHKLHQGHYWHDYIRMASMVTKGGKEMQMKEGQMVMMDGKMMGGDKDVKMEKTDK
ncbi:MAG TPA: hypothetical protein VLH80_08995 [Nitrospiraceae bacterium]|nr:hypothetical protein [Nitrospiraceae bacterium]